MKKFPVRMVEAKVKKRRKIKYRRILIAVVILFVVLSFISYLSNLRITNLYIKGNLLYTDQDIIEIAKLEDYPKTFSNSSNTIKKRLLKDIYIKSVSVKKKDLTKIYIEIEEYKPLFLKSDGKVVLSNKEEVINSFVVPLLINYIPDIKYDKFVEEISKVNDDILNRISTIKYDPNDVDDERFFLTMNDGNFVYLTLNKLSNINKYMSIVKNISEEKGILYLDAGGYFQVIK